VNHPTDGLGVEVLCETAIESVGIGTVILTEIETDITAAEIEIREVEAMEMLGVGVSIIVVRGGGTLDSTNTGNQLIALKARNLRIGVPIIPLQTKKPDAMNEKMIQAFGSKVAAAVVQMKLLLTARRRGTGTWTTRNVPGTLKIR
jgi:hypothetical protein